MKPVPANTAIREVLSEKGIDTPVDAVLGEVRRRHGIAASKQSVYNVKSQLKSKPASAAARKTRSPETTKPKTVEDLVDPDGNPTLVVADGGECVTSVSLKASATEAADPVALVVALRGLLRQWGPETVSAMVAALKSE